MHLEDGRVNFQTNQGLGIDEVKKVFSPYPKYTVREIYKSDLSGIEENQFIKPWVQTYKPILLIFSYIFLVCFAIEWVLPPFSLERGMNHFMAGFFLVFSFFKMLDLKGFASSYSAYDIIARKWYFWGYIYVVLELLLGLSFMLGIFPLWINAFTFLLMSISLAGVLNAVLNKQKIQCACLGSVFNLPMSTVTIVENGLMIAMSAYMVICMVRI